MKSEAVRMIECVIQGGQKIVFSSYNTHMATGSFDIYHIQTSSVHPASLFRLLLFLWLHLSELSSTSNCSGCLDVTLYSEEISRLKGEFEDIQRMILGQEQVL